MQETSVQLVGRQQQAALAARNTAAVQADGLTALDPFSAIILTMMESAQDAAPQTPQEPDRPDEKTLAQNAAEALLAGQAPLNLTLPETPVQTVENAVPPDAQTLSALSALTAQAPAQSGQTAAPVQAQPIATDPEAQPQTGEAAQPQITFAAAAQPQTGEARSQGQDTLLHHSDRQMAEQVRARRTDRTEPDRETAALDIDALQAQADARRPQMETQVRMQPVQEQKESAQSVTKQLTDRLQQTLERGDNAFTLRLKPDSLGEVTVRLVEKAGKMTVQISAASEQTVKLLNGDLAALREAVRPMQVEVREAVVETQSSDGSHLAQSFDMGGQFFGQSQQAWSQSHTAHASGGSDWPLDEDAVMADAEQTAQAAQIVRENLLDVYL